MASYTALMNIKVDSKEASRGLNTLSKNLTSIEKTGKKSSTSLSRLEKSFTKIEKSITSASKPIIKMQKSLDKLAGKQMASYQKLVNRLMRDNVTLTKTVDKLNLEIGKNKKEISGLNQKLTSLSDKLTKVTDKMKGLGDKTKKQEGLFDKLGKVISRNDYLFTSLAGTIVSFIQINIIGYLIRVTDQFILIQNRIRLVNSDFSAFSSNLKAVKQIALDTRQSLYAIANLFSRVGRNSKELGKDTVALAQTVSVVAKSFQIAGATAEEARNAITQLSQALASGRLQGDELRSILELAPTLANSISKSLKISLGDLRTFAAEGMITTDIITAAVRKSAKEINEEFKKIVPTIAQGIQNIQTSFQILFGENQRIQLANNKLALSFMKIGRAFSELSNNPLIDRLGKFLIGIVNVLPQLIAGFAAFVAVLGVLGAALLTVVGLLKTYKLLLAGFAAGSLFAAAPYIAGFGALALAITAGVTAFNLLDNAIENVDKKFKSNNEILKEAADSVEKYKEEAIKSGKALTDAQIAQRKNTEEVLAYEKELSFLNLTIQDYEANLKIINLDLEEQTLLLQQNKGTWAEWGRSIGMSTAVGIDELTKFFNYFITNPVVGAFSKDMKKELDELNKPMVMGGKKGGYLYQLFFGDSDPELLEAEAKRIEDAIEKIRKREEELQKEIDARTPESKDPNKLLLEGYQKRLDATRRIAALEADILTDTLRMKFEQPFNIRIEGVQSNIDDFAINLSKTINEKFRKAFPKTETIFDPELIRNTLSTQIGAGGTATDLASLAQKGSFTDFRESAVGKSLEDIITNTIFSDKKVIDRLKDDQGGTVEILNIEIKEEVAKALRSLYVDLVSFEVDLAVEFKNKERSQHKLNESKLLELRNLKLENSLFGDGLALYENKVRKTREEYDLKIRQLKTDYDLEAIGEKKYKAQLALLEAEKNIAIEIENQKKAASDIAVIQSLENKSRDASQAERLASVTLKASKELTSQSQRRKFIDEKSAEIARENFDLLMKRKGITGELLEIAILLFELEQKSIKGRKDIIERQELQKLLEKDQLELQYERVQLAYEERNLISSRERLDTFLMKDQIKSINEYNSALIRMAQAQGLDPKFLRTNIEYLESFGIYMLEIPEKIDGIEDRVLDNLKEREKLLLKILKLEQNINKEKNKEENPFFKEIKRIFPDAGKSGSPTNEAFTEIFDSMKLFSKNMESMPEILEQREKLGVQKGPRGFIPEGFDSGDKDTGILGMLKGIPGIDAIFGAPAAGGMVEAISSALAQSFSMLGDILGAGFDGMISSIGGVYGVLARILTSTLKSEQFQEAMNTILEPFNEFFDMIGEGIGEVFRGVSALVEPLMGIFDLFGGFIKGIFRSFIRVIEPFGRLFERFQPILISLGALLQSLLMVFNSIFEFVGNLFDQVLNFFDPTTDSNYKSLVLLKSERDVIQDIESSLEGVADVLNDIDDALFDITNSSLNLAAPSLKLETAAEKYQELYAAATRFGADETAINDFTAFAKQFLQQSQDVLKSSSTYQDIYDNVIKDVMAISDNFVEELSTDVTETIQKGVFDLKVVGSDLGEAIENIVSKYESGAISFGTLADYMSLKLSQIEADIELRDMADFGAIDIGNELDRYAKMRGTPSSGKSLEDDLKELSGVNSSLTSAVLDLIDEIQDSNGGVGGRSTGRRGPNLSGLEEVDEGQIGRPDPKDNPFDLFSVDLGAIFENLAQFVIDALTHAFEQIIGTFEELLNIVLEPVRRLTDGSFAKMIEHLFESIFGLITDGKFVKFLEEFFGSLFGIFTNVNFGDFIETFFGGFFEAIGEITSAKFLQELLSFIPKIAVSVGDFLSNLFAPILDLVGKLNPLHYLFGNSPSGILAPIVALVVDVGDFLSGLFEPITNLVVDVGDWVSAAIIEPMSNMGNLDIADWVENILLKPVRDLSVGLIDYFTAILFPILSIGEVAFDTYMSLVFYPLRDLYMNIGDFILEIFKPITGMGDVSMSEFLNNLFKPLENLTVDITDWFSSLVSDPISTMGDLDPQKFLSALIDPLSNLGSIDGSQVISALLKPLEDIGSIDLQEWIGSVISDPLSKLTGGTFSDLLNALTEPITSLAGTSIDDLLDALMSPFTSLPVSIDNFLKTILKPITDLDPGIEEYFNKLFDPIIKLATDYGTVITKLLSAIFKGEGYDISEFVGDLLDMVTSFASGAFDLASWGASKIANIFNFNSGSFDISKFVQDSIGSILNFAGGVIDFYKLVNNNIGRILSFQGVVDITSKVLDVINLGSSFIDLTTYITDALKGMFGVPAGEKIQLLKNPFEPFIGGPKYFLEFEKGGRVPSYNSGGMLRGPSHRDGGIPGTIGGTQPVEMEGGEYIINKKSTKEIGLAFLNRLNSVNNQREIPNSIIKFAAGGRAEELATGSSQASFNLIDFSAETGGTIRDIIGHHGINIDIGIPGLITNPGKGVSIFQSGGLAELSAEENQKARDYVTKNANISDSSTIFRLGPTGNDILGRASLEMGAKNSMTSPVFNAMYEPPSWVPEWVKETIEAVGTSIADAISNPAGFIENLSQQIGEVIQSLTEAIGVAISEIFDVLGLEGLLDDIFPGFGGGGGGVSPYNAMMNVVAEIRDLWYPDDAQAVTLISSLLNLDMMKDDILEIKSNVQSLLLEWMDFSMGFFQGVGNAKTYGQYLFNLDIFKGLSATPQGDNTDFMDALSRHIIGGTATRKAFQHQQRVFDPLSFDMNTPVPRIQFGKMDNPFLGQNQETRPSGKQGYLWDALSTYGKYDSENQRIIPNWGFIDMTEVRDFMGGMDKNKTGIFAQLFGRGEAEGDDGRKVFSDYKGGSPAELAAMGFAGKNYNDIFRESFPIRDLDNSFAYRMQILVANIYKFLAKQKDPSAVLNLDFNRIKLAPARNNQQSIRSQIMGMPSDGAGFYKEGGSVIGPSHGEGGVFAELEGGEYVLNKDAVSRIGLSKLNKLNYGKMRSFQNGGPVIGRRDYDPLLAQAITEQYRNAELEGGTFDQISSIYNQISGTGLSADTAASLTEIFGVPRGFFDEINFEGLTDDGISNSIIDGISDVFESPGDPTGSYPVTVVSEEMYLKNMTKPLDAVIVNTDSYLAYMTEPLPSNIYKSNYLSSIFAPLGVLDSEVDSNDYLRRLFLPVTYVELSNTAMTEAFADLVDSVTINSQDFSDSVVSKIEELPFLELDEANFLSNFLSPLENLVISQENFLALLKPIFDAILVDASEYTQLALSPIQGIIPTETEVLDNFFNAFSNVESDNLTKVFEDILYEIFDFSVITGAIDDLVEKYSTDGNSDSDLRLTFGSSDLIDKLDELWESGLVVDLRNIETKAYGQIEELLKQNTEILVDNLPESVPGGGGGGNQGGGRQGDTTAPSLYDIIVGGENSDLRKLGDLILTPEGRDQILGEVFGNPTEVFKNLNDFLDINTKTIQEFDFMDIPNELSSFLDNQAYNLTSTDRLVDWLDQNTDTLNLDFENIEVNPFKIYENFKEANLNDMQKQVADTLVTGFGTAGMDAALEAVLGLPTFDGVGITAFLVAYEAANPGKLAEGFDNLTSLEPGDKDRNALAALLSGQTGGAFDLSDDFDGLIDIGNMYKVPRDQLLDFFGLDGIDVGDPLRGQDIRDIGAYDVQGTDIERAINSILPTGLDALNEFYNLRDELGIDINEKGVQTTIDDFRDYLDEKIIGERPEYIFDMTGEFGPRPEQFFDMTGFMGPNPERFFDMTGFMGPRPERFFDMTGIKDLDLGFDFGGLSDLSDDFDSVPALDVLGERLRAIRDRDYGPDFEKPFKELSSAFESESINFSNIGINANQDVFSGMNFDYSNVMSGIGTDFGSNLFSTESNILGQNSLLSSGLGISYDGMTGNIGNNFDLEMLNVGNNAIPSTNLFGLNIQSSFDGALDTMRNAFNSSIPGFSGGGGGSGGGGVAGAVQDVANKVRGALGFGRGGFVQFKDGGLAKGPSHQGGMLGLTEDGMPFMFEGGEYIINKKSADVLGEGFLNSINNFGLGGFVRSVGKSVVNKAISFAPTSAKEIFERGISPGGFMPMPGSILEAQLKEKEREDRALARMKKAREDYEKRLAKQKEQREEYLKRIVKQREEYEKRVASQEAIRQKRMMDMQKALSIRIPSYSSSSSLGSFDTMMGIDPTIARRDTQGVPPSTFSSGGSQMTNSLGKGISISNVLLSQLISTLENKDLSVTIVDEQGNERDDSRLQIRRKSQLEYRNASELV